MQSAAHSLKFCGARAQVACVILAHAKSCMMFHGYFKSTCTIVPNNTAQSFSEAKDSSPSRFLLMIVTLCCKSSKSNVFLSLIVTFLIQQTLQK